MCSFRRGERVSSSATRCRSPSCSSSDSNCGSSIAMDLMQIRPGGRSTSIEFTAALNAQVLLQSRIFTVKATTLPGKEKFMKVRLFLASLAVAGLAVSSAVAAPPEGKGKPRTGEGCKPQITVVLKGTLSGTPSTAALDMNVTG